MKKRVKSFVSYSIMMSMAHRFDLSQAKQEMLIDILNEPALEDCDIVEIIDQTNRIIALFGLSGEQYSRAYMEERARVIELNLVRSN